RHVVDIVPLRLPPHVPSRHRFSEKIFPDRVGMWNRYSVAACCDPSQQRSVAPVRPARESWISSPTSQFSNQRSISVARNCAFESVHKTSELFFIEYF